MRESDAFHEAMSLDPNPFSFIALPLEWIHADAYVVPGHKRRQQIKEFRRVATPRERYWVDKLNAMWPFGWNSAVPGQPLAAYVLRQHQCGLVKAEAEREERTDFAQQWVQQWKAQPEAAMQLIARQPKPTMLIARQPKPTIRDRLHHLQAQHQPSDLIVNGQSPVPLLISELQKRRTEAPSRQFLKFRFTSNSARDLLIREVLRDPTVYHKHPEPDTAAAIMVSDSFDPQIQGFLFNYTEAAIQLNLAQAQADDLNHCACRNSFRYINPEDLGPSGHVCTFDTANLKWGYLASLKKFRIPATSDTVATELGHGLRSYVDWATQINPDQQRAQKLEEWAEAVRIAAMRNWRTAQSKKPVTEMDGFPGLKQAIREAREHLVFLHDDRAPHGLFLVCKRWYQKE